MCLGWLHTGWPAFGRFLRFCGEFNRIFTPSAVHHTHGLYISHTFFSSAHLGIQRDVLKLCYRACAHELCNTLCNPFDTLTVKSIIIIRASMRLINAVINSFVNGLVFKYHNGMWCHTLEPERSKTAVSRDFVYLVNMQISVARGALESNKISESTGGGGMRNIRFHPVCLSYDICNGDRHNTVSSQLYKKSRVCVALISNRMERCDLVI